VCTKNHEFYVRKKLRIQYKGKRDIVATSPNWIPAKDLKKGQNTPHSMGMLGGYPLDMPSKNDQYNLAFWYLVGRYLGDGWLVSYIHPSGYIKKDGTQSNKKSWITCICTSKQDADRLSQKIIKSGFKFNRTEMKTETTFRICNKAFTIFLEQFGKYSHGKFIPEWCFSLPYNKQKVLLQGIIDADGHFETKKNRVTVTSVSKLLSLGIARLFRNVYKNRVSICKKNSIGRVGKIGNRVIQAKHNSFVISTPINSGISTNDNCVWMAFRYITQGEKTAVYNISVDGSESFIVNGIAVHNCKPLACHGDILKKYIESGGLDEQEK
jgi:intein/homing endonuclease